ncbi:unnamed protein product [Didymodactylos carnosus]|uniref:Uncharacterized protein n=1 Tax=Didymodactylos carnosus TaxID=1234261 RepID=A0A8S2W3S3_9BILA|nr:unnamed protein product [Didymodactylos carnosus]CAF4417144.1 unnamed protein product [Didymodactylos carnosus]
MIKQPSIRKAAFNIEYLISSPNDNDRSTHSFDNDLTSIRTQSILSSYPSLPFVHPLTNILCSINPYVGILTNSYNSSTTNYTNIEELNNKITHHKTKYQKYSHKYSHKRQYHQKFGNRSISTEEQNSLINRAHESSR